MNLHEELIRALAGRSITTGNVTAQNSPTSYLVSTVRGPKVCSLATNTPIKAGDKVSLAGDKIVARLPSDDEVPQYVV